MELTFATDAIARWAAFAHDYNPIHFSPEAARKAGSADIIVHGMLAVLPVKEMLGRLAAREQAPTAWRQFRARFKRPVPARRDLQVRVATKPGSLDFTLTQVSAGKPNILGQIASVPAPRSEAGRPEDTDEYVLSAESLTLRDADFRGRYPDVSQPWVVLDAIVFSEFLGTMLAGVMRRTQPDLTLEPDLSGATDVLVVQTSHSVQYDETWSADAALGTADLVCRVGAEPPLALPNGVAGEVTVTCFHGGRHVMTVGIGLMMIWSAKTTEERVPHVS